MQQQQKEQKSQNQNRRYILATEQNSSSSSSSGQSDMRSGPGPRTLALMREQIAMPSALKSDPEFDEKDEMEPLPKRNPVIKPGRNATPSQSSSSGSRNPASATPTYVIDCMAVGFENDEYNMWNISQDSDLASATATYVPDCMAVGFDEDEYDMWNIFQGSDPARVSPRNPARVSPRNPAKVPPRNPASVSPNERKKCKGRVMTLDMDEYSTNIGIHDYQDIKLDLDLDPDLYYEKYIYRELLVNPKVEPESKQDREMYSGLKYLFDPEGLEDLEDDMNDNSEFELESEEDRELKDLEDDLNANPEFEVNNKMEREFVLNLEMIRDSNRKHDLERYLRSYLWYYLTADGLPRFLLSDLKRGFLSDQEADLSDLPIDFVSKMTEDFVKCLTREDSEKCLTRENFVNNLARDLASNLNNCLKLTPYQDRCMSNEEMRTSQECAIERNLAGYLDSYLSNYMKNGLVYGWENTPVGKLKGYLANRLAIELGGCLARKLMGVSGISIYLTRATPTYVQYCMARGFDDDEFDN